MCLPCLWPSSLGPLHTPSQVLRKFSRAFAGTEIWGLLCSLLEPAPRVERQNMNVNNPWCFEISLPIPTFQLHLKRVRMFMTYFQSSFEPEFWWVIGDGLIDICKMLTLSMRGVCYDVWARGKTIRIVPTYAIGKETARALNMCTSLEALEDSWQAHKHIMPSGFEWCLCALLSLTF